MLQSTLVHVITEMAHRLHWQSVICLGTCSPDLERSVGVDDI